jgi:hypothetical protein
LGPIFSPAQLVGYIAFVLGVTAFSQKADHRLKAFSAGQGVVYSLHFLLLGNLPACAAAFLSATRSTLALRYRSLALAAVMVALNLAAGAAFVRTPAGWLPVVGSCIAAAAMFTLGGVPLRLCLLCSTFLWLTNDIVSGSIGGTLLELTIAAVSSSTIWRMSRAAEAVGTKCPSEAETAV